MKKVASLNIALTTLHVLPKLSERYSTAVHKNKMFFFSLAYNTTCSWFLLKQFVFSLLICIIP